MKSRPRKAADYGFLLAAASAGGYIGFADAPDTWPTAVRAAVAGVAGVASVAFAWGLADFLAPLLQDLRQATADRAAPEAPPATLADGISRLEEATAADAAQRAADDAVQIDRGQMLLTHGDQWRGYRDGTATFFLAPGAHLRYWWDTQAGGNTPAWSSRSSPATPTLRSASPTCGSCAGSWRATPPELRTAPAPRTRTCRWPDGPSAAPSPPGRDVRTGRWR